MTRAQVISELKALSPEERLSIAEELLRLVKDDLRKATPRSRKHVRRARMRDASRALLEDYASEGELTAFTALDGEDFYAAG